MKRFLFITMVVLASACAKSDKFAKIENGMKSSEVVDILGTPEDKTNVFGDIEWWDYNTHIVVIDADTVVNCISKKEAEKEAEELQESLDSLSSNVKKQIDELDKVFSE